MNSQYIFHFSNGDELIPDHTFKEGFYRLGELVFFENEPTVWVIKEIQHQFRRGGTKYVLTNIFLEELPARA